MKYITSIKHNYAVTTAVLLLLLIVTTMEINVLRFTNGIFSYPLDDAYIHMAIAKNLAFFQNWGVTPFEFGSASSSIFYTILLAGTFKIFSTGVFIPVILNIVAGIIFLVVVNSFFAQQQLRQSFRLVLFLLLIFITPLPTIIVSGMEHTLHCLFSFLFISTFSTWHAAMKTAEGKKTKLPWQLVVYAVLALSLRYESVFFVATACFILLLNKKVVNAFVLGSIALLPIVVFGLYSMSMGSYFFPNSVLLKAGGDYSFTPGGIAFMLQDILQQRLTIPKNVIAGLATQRLLIVLPLVYLLFRKNIVRTQFHYMMVLLMVSTILHLSFSGVGFFFRYEAYLFANTTIVAGVLLAKYGKSIWQQNLKPSIAIASLILFALCFPVLNRSISAFSKATTASINIHEQQYQMAQFIKMNYPNEPIAANDIGAINFFSPAHHVDLLGLGNIEVARSKKEKYYTADFLHQLSTQKNVKVAMVYDTWFPKELLDRWQKVASWEISNNVACANATVSFYAADKTAAPGLKKKLLSYHGTHLPKTVKVMYY